MDQLEKQKLAAISTVKMLCARCRNNEVHDCPVSRLVDEIVHLRGVPVTVNDKLWHVVFM
jgi:hypothetical protein